MQLRNTRLGRLPLPAAARQHKVFQIASLAQANGPSCALVPPGCCSLLQERMMIAQSAPAQWGRAGGGGDMILQQTSPLQAKWNGSGMRTFRCYPQCCAQVAVLPSSHTEGRFLLPV